MAHINLNFFLFLFVCYREKTPCLQAFHLPPPSPDGPRFNSFTIIFIFSTYHLANVVQKPMTPKLNKFYSCNYNKWLPTEFQLAGWDGTEETFPPCALESFKYGRLFQLNARTNYVELRILARNTTGAARCAAKNVRVVAGRLAAVRGPMPMPIWLPPPRTHAI